MVSIDNRSVGQVLWRRLEALARRVGALLKTPIWIAALATDAKSFQDNPIIGSVRLNRRGLHVARMRLAHRLAARRRRRLADRVAPGDRAAFERDGFVLKRDFLPRGEFAALLAELRAFRGAGREMPDGDTITRRMALDPKTLARLPNLARLVNSPALQALTRYVGSVDAEPIFYLQTILTRVRDGVPDPQRNLHSDTFHPTMKAWFFLDDVADAGFTYVPGAHRATPKRLDWERRMSLTAPEAPDRLTRRGSFRIDPAALPALGLPPPHTFLVPANTLIVADTCGFHARGPSARPVMRVELWAYGRQAPFQPWVWSIWSILPGLARRRALIFWWWMDRLESLGLARNPWRRKMDVSPFDAA